MTDQTLELDENSQMQVRKEKLAKLATQHVVSYPNDFKPKHFAADCHKEYSQYDKPSLEAMDPKPYVFMAGRIMLRRIMGKASFVTIQDMTGQIQAYLKGSDITEDLYEEFKHLWDLGDIMAVEGFLFKTNTGELTIHGTSIRLLTKALRPLPDKFHGYADQELCYRKRYVDLIMNQKTRECFIMRSKIIDTLRQFLKSHRFLEVETPMLHTLAGGAAAKPFVTHHNALGMDMFLRIAPELFLKRLVVGGFDRVFEINRNFRNEGLSTRHNPEFTMVEFYQAYATYEDMMNLTEELFQFISQSVLGTTKVQVEGKTIDFSHPFHRLSITQSITTYHPHISAASLQDPVQIRKVAESVGVSTHKEAGIGKIQLDIFEKIVEHLLIEPTFIMDYPAEVSPLARRNDQNPDLTDRFELFIGGREIANGFSELNDPVDQAGRFSQQMQAKIHGDEEAMPFDHDYIEALEYGLPPTAGEGIGIDRLVMLLTQQTTIKDVILFPHMKPKAPTSKVENNG